MIESRGQNFLELSVVEQHGPCYDSHDKPKNYLTLLVLTKVLLSWNTLYSKEAYLYI